MAILTIAVGVGFFAWIRWPGGTLSRPYLPPDARLQEPSKPTAGSGVSLPTATAPASPVGGVGNRVQGSIEEQVRDGLDHFALQRILDSGLEVLVASAPGESLTALADYLAHTDSETRYLAAKFVAVAGLASDDAAVRQEATGLLVGALSDQDPLVWQHSAKDLLLFEPEDFSLAGRGSLSALLAQNATPGLVRVIGVAEMIEEDAVLAEMIDEARERQLAGQIAQYGSLDWAIRLARARLGNEDDASIVLETILAEEDEVFLVTRLLKDLAYTRDPKAVAAIVGYLQSDGRLPQYSSAVPGSFKAQYAVSVLAGMFEGFPVPALEPGEYSLGDIRRARRWMSDAPRWTEELSS